MDRRNVIRNTLAIGLAPFLLLHVSSAKKGATQRAREAATSYTTRTGRSSSSNPEKRTASGWPDVSLHSNRYVQYEVSRFMDSVRRSGQPYNIDMLSASGQPDHRADIVFEYVYEDTILISTTSQKRGLYPPVIVAGPEDLSSPDLLRSIAIDLLGDDGIQPNSTVRLIPSRRTPDDIKSGGLAALVAKGTVAAGVIPRLEVDLFGQEAVRSRSYSIVGERARWYLPFGDCCLFVTDATKKQMPHLQKKIVASKTVVISLFSDSQTGKDLSRRLGKRVAVSHPDQLGDAPLQAITDRLTNLPPDTLVLVVGHLDGESFRLEGQNQLSVPASELTELAERNGHHLVMVGCNAAGLRAAQRATGSSISRIYPRELAAGIADALATSGSLETVLRRLSSEANPILLGAPAPRRSAARAPTTRPQGSRRPTVSARVVREDNRRNVPYTIATIEFYPSSPCTMEDSCKK